MNNRTITLAISTVVTALLAGAVGGVLMAHRERISALENEVQQLRWATDLNEAKVDHLIEGTELSRKLKEPVGDDLIKVVNVTMADTVLMELRDTINHYLKSRGDRVGDNLSCQ